ncbi:MAG TPA: FAD-binding oxidoreductase [Solibacterales bacterium]|nr:FAD-binding oxidoreductase [Bryobacterales bacterium]
MLREATAAGMPVTIAGAGTGVTGGRVAQGGWVVSLERFRGLDLNGETATAGAGVALSDVQAAARRKGRFYAPDPTEWSASVGGTIATNASGSRSFRYGATRGHVLALTVVLSNGEVRRYRRGEAIDFDVPRVRAPQARKHSAGYPLAPGMDWVDLFIGSEGTLGVVTGAELRLLPLPGALLAGVLFFEGTERALAACGEWRGVAGLRMLEYMDQGSLHLLRARFPEIPAAATDALLIEHELASAADEDAWHRRMEEAGALADSWLAAGDADRERFRRFRHALPECVNDTVRRNGFLKLGSDYAAPVARNAEMMACYRRRLDEEFPGQTALFGHLGDAHVHANILPRSKEEAARGAELMLEFARKAIELGGSISAEHGLGKRKAHLLALQYSGEEIEAMKAVKRRLDPQWLLGRGTLFAG